MAMISDIIAEMADIEQLLNNAHVSDRVKAALIESLVGKVGRVKVMDPTGAASFLQALECGSISGAHRKPLQAAVEDRLSECIQAGSKKKIGQEPQQLTNILSYVSNDDWLEMSRPGPVNVDAMINQICKRLVRLDMVSLHEQTVKAVAQVLLHLYCDSTKQWPTYHEIYSLV